MLRRGDVLHNGLGRMIPGITFDGACSEQAMDRILEALGTKTLMRSFISIEVAHETISTI